MQEAENMCGELFGHELVSDVPAGELFTSCPAPQHASGLVSSRRGVAVEPEDAARVVAALKHRDRRRAPPGRSQP